MTKRKLARSAGSIFLSLALAVSGITPGVSSVMTAYAADTVTIVPASDTDETKQGTGNMDISLSITKAIENSWVTLSDSALTYTGSTLKPTVTVKYTVGGTEQTLTENTDYTVTIKDSSETEVTEPKNVGTYTITVTAIEGSFYTGSGSKTYEIKKSTPDAPAAPTVESKTKTSVTLTAVEGYEYSKDGTNWQVGNEFTGLLPGTEYSFYQRVAATDNTNASTSSAKLTVTTEEDTYSMTITLVITAEEAATNMMNNLPDADQVTVGDKDAIEAAREAYDALTDDQKAKVSADTLKKLTDAESALEVAVVNKAIADLPNADNVAVNDKDAIEAARTAYEALTDDQKMAVDADTLAKLEAVEVALVNKTIEALPEAASVTANDKDAIEAAKAAYDALSDTQKTKVDADDKSKLEVCQVALAIAELPAANKVTANDKAAIEAARKAYDALTDAQKKLVSADTLKKLTDTEATLKDLTDTAAAKEVADAINKLPANDKVATTDKAAIEAARKAYDALTADQKKKVSADTLKKLTGAETALTAAEKKAAEEEAAKELAAAKQVAQAAMNSEIKVSVKGKKIKVQWTKTTSADGYDVYVQYCGKKITKPVKTIKKNSTTKTTIKKINGKKLNLKKQFRVYVVAYKMIDGKKVKLAKSNTGHVVGTKNKKYTNVKSIKLKKKAYTVAVGKTTKVKAKVKLVDKNKKHIPKSHGAKFRYRTSDSSIATVSKSGKIKGIKKGKCTIYVYAINGKMKKVKVTVK